MLPAGIALRPQTDADRDFIDALYASTREEELRAVGWPEEVKAAFLRSQSDAQWKHYSTHYYDADFLIVERDGVPVGRLYIWRGEDDIRVVDIALMPHERGHGLGTVLLSGVLDEAARSGKTASIHVERFNPALHLYRRLGFEHISDDGVYYLMRWTSSAGQPKTA